MACSSAKRVILVMGAPGSAKGTVCQGLVATQPDLFVHVSTGDMVREHVEQSTELGKRFATYLAKNDYVPEHLMISLVRDRLGRPDVAGKTVLLDGFPRTRSQAAALVSSFEIDRAVLLQSSDDLCVQRILGRRVDPVTSQVYNIHAAHAKPPTDEIAKRLVTRDSDKDEATIRGRLRSFHSFLPGLLVAFKGKVFAINSAQEKQRVVDAALDVLERHVPSAAELAQLEAEVQEQQRLAAAAAAKPTVVVKDRRGECIVCRDAPADFLCLPCGHQCGCKSCLELMRSQNFGGCPICRTKIQGIVQVFQSGHVDEDCGAVDEAASPAEDEGGRAAAASAATAARRRHDNNGMMTADDILGAGWLQQYQSRMKSNSNINNTVASAASPAPVAVPTVAVALCEARGGSTSAKMAVTINVPDVAPTMSIDVCCVIDISGSMGSEATFQNPDDETQTVGSGMMNLDLVKHAVKTIIETLGDNDRLSLVAFDDKVDRELPLTALNAAGKKKAADALAKLEPRGATNIWGGLLDGLESVRIGAAAGDSPHRKKFIFCLTDGRPNYSPPAGEDAELRKYLAQHASSGFRCMISTFGFGYTLKSKLLLDVARVGGGTFAFIPDAKLLGTCFVNAVANARTCCALDVKVRLAVKNGASFAPAPVVDTSLPLEMHGANVVVVDLGPLHAGQNRDLVVNLQHLDKATAGDEVLDVAVQFADGAQQLQATGKLSSAPTQAAIAANARNTACAAFATIIYQCDEDRADEAHEGMRVLAGKITALEALMRHAVIKGLAADINGRAAKACSTEERWERWGAHYLRALYRSHQYQMRTNFMDIGLQPYGGNLFDGLVEIGGTIFKRMPMVRTAPLDSIGAAAVAAPRATLMIPPNMPQPRAAPRPPTPPADNEAYYGGSGGGCFAGECLVVTEATGSSKAVRDVRRGDRLRLANGKFATVDVVVELRAPRSDMVTLPDSGLVITPNHPLRSRGGSWTRPRVLLAAGRAERCAAVQAAVFNFVLDKRPTCGLEVNGVECVTYLHAVPEMQHKFYTSDAVMQELRSEEGFDAGYVCVPRTTLKLKKNCQQES